MDFFRFKTSSPAGDLISFLAGMKQVYEDTGRKAIVYQRLGMVGLSHENSIHPFGNEQNEPIAMNKYMFDMLRPLLISQEYVEDFVGYDGQEFEFDLDMIRRERFCNQPHGSLNRWFFYVFPQMACDLSKKWLDIVPTAHDKIIINFTQRHRNYLITYFFLKNYQDRIIFAGLKEERDLFCNQWGLDIPHLEVTNFLELTQKIAGCKFYMGCQSFCFQLAEATKTPRILEIFPMMPNVIPVGDKAYDFYTQTDVEYRFEKLAK
tara:strand:- start:6285 stop:7073 length:789 start_codon:yes stop_codon:yes gene_type:complete